MKEEKLYQMREEYSHTPLEITKLNDNPLPLFDSWFKEALKEEEIEVNSMVLSTANLAGRVSSRVVLLKGYSSEGFLFFTNYLSKKGRELTLNPYGALLFHWPKGMRQVRVEGRVKRATKEQSDTYFKERPRVSQASSALSKQSTPLLHKERFLSSVDLLAKGEEPIGRPPYWGGYIVEPTLIEFWQGGTGRLHDRVLYLKKNEGWSRERLYP